MGLASTTESDDTAVELLLNALFERNRTLQVPSPRLFGIDEKKYRTLIPTMAEQALASGSPGNNPRVPTFQEIEALYLEIWD
jgi:alcohol dehydrogenase class IV